MSAPALLETHNLSKYFFPRQGLLRRKKEFVKALEDVNLTIYPQETLGVVGESGCGKTTLGRVLLDLIPATSGQVLFEGRDLRAVDKRQRRSSRRKMQIVFQNPYSSFDPRFSVLRSLTEPLRTHTQLRGADLEKQARQLLEQVGMSAEALQRYPHEFSGGQLQRIAVARALALSPQFIVLDEPTSSLDVSVQAQILNLLSSLQQQLHLTYLFISHDLSVVEYISSRIAVMYLGKVVELITTPNLIAGKAQHPYTQALLAAVPQVFSAQQRSRAVLPGGVSGAVHPPGGCSFHPRCPFAMDICRQVEPPLVQIEEGHLSACHLNAN
jgi:oligopeptide/dipeptide ABC transporter ATP-binding protein